jgi:type IV secretion system protein VirD4
LGYLTERREARSVSYTAGRGSSSSVSRSEERRALMLPQELRELSGDQQIVLVQGLKPILTRKIRYYDDANFCGRLLPPPPAVPIDTALQGARGAGEVRSLEPADIAGGVELQIVAHDLDDLPAIRDGATDEEIQRLVDWLMDYLGVTGAPDEVPQGGGEGGREVPAGGELQR